MESKSVLSKYWYKAVGTSLLTKKVRTFEGSLAAASADVALSVLKGQKDAWQFVDLSVIHIYRIDDDGEMEEEPILSTSNLGYFEKKSHDVTEKPEKKESIADVYEDAEWTREYDKPKPFNVVRLK